jgi:hypothetical protein
MPKRRGNLEIHGPKALSDIRLSVAPVPVLPEIVTIKVAEYQSDVVTVEYKTLPGNHPKSNGNKLWFWEGTVVNWSHPNLGTSELVPSDDEKGWVAMDVELGRKSYTFGYSVTGDVMGICASAPLNVPALMLAPPSVMIEIDTIEPDQLLISYATLRGYRPLSAGNWLGLWRGDVLPWDVQPPTAVALPEDDANEGTATFLAMLRPKSTYTVIYFMADKENQTQNTSAAALLRFDTS